MMLIQLHFIKQTVTDFVSFIFSPKAYNNKTISTKHKIFASLILLILKFSFSILVAGILGLFYEPKNLTDQSLSERFSPFMYLIVGGTLLPLLEELLFRLSLKFKPIYLVLTSICAGYYIATKFVFHSRLSSFDDTIYYRICIGLLTGICVLLILKNKKILDFLRDIWVRKFSIIYYMSAVVFAWLHLFNFELTLINLLLLPIITLPQLFSGLMMGYLRISFGFLYPLLIHIATNSILIGLDIILKN